MPVFLGGDVFDSHEEDNNTDNSSTNNSNNDLSNACEIGEHELGGFRIRIRETAFHPTNANFVWDASKIMADFIVSHGDMFEGKRILELGSATGIGAIFMMKLLNLRSSSSSLTSTIATSDYADAEIESNIRFNFLLNGFSEVDVPRHFPHTWGSPVPDEMRNFDLIVASDILLYVNHYASLIKTLKMLLTDPQTNAPVPERVFLMAWKRRLRFKSGEKSFFDLLADEKGDGGTFELQQLGGGMFKIRFVPI